MPKKEIATIGFEHKPLTPTSSLYRGHTETKVTIATRDGKAAEYSGHLNLGSKEGVNGRVYEENGMVVAEYRDEHGTKQKDMIPRENIASISISQGTGPETLRRIIDP